MSSVKIIDLSFRQLQKYGPSDVIRYNIYYIYVQHVCFLNIYLFYIDCIHRHADLDNFDIIINTQRRNQTKREKSYRYYQTRKHNFKI